MNRQFLKPQNAACFWILFPSASDTAGLRMMWNLNLLIANLIHCRQTALDLNLCWDSINILGVKEAATVGETCSGKASFLSIDTTVHKRWQLQRKENNLRGCLSDKHLSAVHMDTPAIMSDLNVLEASFLLQVEKKKKTNLLTACCIRQALNSSSFFRNHWFVHNLKLNNQKLNYVMALYYTTECQK